ncbi:MAG: extracellular solute-binding protein [Candidatus Humimicrobiia bacterium]
MKKVYRYYFEILIKLFVIFFILSIFNLYVSCKFFKETEVTKEPTKETEEITEEVEPKKIEEPIDLELWISSEYLGDNERIENKTLYEKLKEFKDENSNINLIVKIIPEKDLDSKITKTFQIARDNLPDLGLTYDFSIVVEDKIAKPMDDLISDNLKNDIFPFALDGRTIDGKLLGLMLNADAKLLLYRKDLFEEVDLDPDNPPTNWSDLIDKGKLLTKDNNEDGVIDTWALGLPSKSMDKITSDFIFPNYFSLGGSLINKEGFPIFHLEQNREKIIDILNFTISILNENIISKRAPEEGNNLLLSEYIQGKYAMIVVDSSIPFKLKTENPDIYDKTGFSLIPGRYGTKYSTLEGPSICLFTNDSEKKEAAATLIDYLMKVEFYSKWCYYNEKLPVTKSSYQTSLLKMDNLYQVFNELCENGKPIPDGYVIYETLYNELEKNINLAISGNITPEDAIIQAGETVSKMVEE